MARWLIQLEGDRFDLEEIPVFFPDGEVHAIDTDGFVYLVGEALEGFADAVKVREAAMQALEEMSAAIGLLWPDFRKPAIGRILREGENGKEVHGVLVAELGTMRMKARGAVLTVSGVEPEPPGPTRAQRLVAGSKTNRHLEVATLLWADSVKTWSRLYRVVEEIEGYLGQPVDKASFCSDNERKRFRRSANSAEIAGKDARHGLGKWDPPKNPMELAEATSFARELLRCALERAANERTTKVQDA